MWVRCDGDDDDDDDDEWNMWLFVDFPRDKPRLVLRGHVSPRVDSLQAATLFPKIKGSMSTKDEGGDRSISQEKKEKNTTGTPY